MPPLNPATKEPVGPDDLAPIFPMALIEQEVSADPEIEIPEEVREIYSLWRPTPLFRARRLENALDTPAHIYYKYEGVSPAGSHKPNTAVPQAYYNREAGIRQAGHRDRRRPVGLALALACKLFGLECEVFMVGVSYDQKPYRRAMIETWGATVHRSPSDLTDAGPRAGRAPDRQPRHRDLRGDRDRRRPDDTNYSLGSVLNHVLPAPDGDRPGGHRAARDGRRVPGRRDRLRRRRVELRRHRLSASCAASSARAATPASSRSSRPPARP